MANKRKTNDQRIAEYQAKIKRIELKKQIDVLRQQLKKKT